MKELSFNWLAILLAAVVRIVIGGLWYSPAAFGPAFMRLTGCTPQEMRSRLPRALVSDVIGTLIMAFILAHAVYYAAERAHGSPARRSVCSNWPGFIAARPLRVVMYEKRPLQLSAICTMAIRRWRSSHWGAILGQCLTSCAIARPEDRREARA